MEKNLLLISFHFARCTSDECDILRSVSEFIFKVHKKFSESKKYWKNGKWCRKKSLHFAYQF